MLPRWPGTAGPMRARSVASGDSVSRFGERSTGRDSRLGLATVASRPGGSGVSASGRSLGTRHCGSCRCISECFEGGCKVPYQSRLKVVLGASDLVGFGPVTRASGRSGDAPPPAAQLPISGSGDGPFSRHSLSHDAHLGPEGSGPISSGPGWILVHWQAELANQINSWRFLRKFCPGPARGRPTHQ